MREAANLAIPAVLLLVSLLLLFSKRDLLPALGEGLREGMQVSVSVFPTLLLFMVGVGMLSASGFPELLAKLLAPLGEALGIPLEILPLILLRPFTGSGSTALLTDLFAQYGADSVAGLCASVLMGASETMVYVLSLYFSSVGVRRTRYAYPVAFFVMLVCILLSCALTRAYLV